MLSLPTGSVAPCISTRLRSSNSGVKNGSPWMWSQWVCEMKSEQFRGPSAASCSPSGRMPVPASRISSSPLAVSTEMQVVLPPYRTVDGPGTGSEPRVPQNLMIIALQSRPMP